MVAARYFANGSDNNGAKKWWCKESYYIHCNLLLTYFYSCCCSFMKFVNCFSWHEKKMTYGTISPPENRVCTISWKH